MTTTVIDTKTCPECCRQFHRSPNHSRREFAARKFCSTPCAAASKRDRRGPRALAAPSQKWMRRAACVDSWEDFVPDSRVEAQPALQECRNSRCPVAAECLAFALATRAYGVWGGQFIRYGEVA